MRILIVSDLHANPEALAVLPEADAALCAGDLVDFGPDPAAAIAWCRERGAVVVTGNHDLALSRRADCGVQGTMRAASIQTREAHRRILRAEEIAYLSELPIRRSVTLGSTTFALAHATADDAYRYAPLEFAGKTLAERVPEAAVYVLGHTHLQGLIERDGKLILNPGSVGMASQGGVAHYALWEDGRLTLHAAPYDVEAAIERLRRLELDPPAFDALAHALRNGRKRSLGDFDRRSTRTHHQAGQDDPEIARGDA
jgi:predicted phosphodiesterase